jgi:hypothetical protein
MIPKIIHYCWFSKETMPLLMQRCIKSWKRIMPDYEIRRWDGNSFDFNSVLFVKQAIEKKKWAFAADYVRLYALYTEGGIYLDSDVEVFKRFDYFLQNSFFAGTDTRNPEQTKYAIEAAIMGAQKGNEYIHKCMDYYKKREFILPNGELDYTVMPDVMADILEPWGYERKNTLQELTSGITIYPTQFFINCNNQFCPDIYAQHRNYNSWVSTEDNRGKLYKFFKTYDLMTVYHAIELIVRKLKNINNQLNS